MDNKKMTEKDDLVHISSHQSQCFIDIFCANLKIVKSVYMRG